MERVNPSEQIRFLEQPPVRGVNKQLIFDLYDIANKFSQVDPEAGIAIFTSSASADDLNLRLSRSPSLENGTLLVSNGDNSTSEQGVTFIHTSMGSLMWDLSLSAHEVKLAVARIDSQALEAGLINSQNGERKYLPPEARIMKVAKFKVSEQFMNPGTARMIFPGEDPQKILAEYDEPDRLEVIETVTGSRQIVLKDESHRTYREINERAAREVLGEHGLSFETIGDLPMDRILELREEIAKRVKDLEENPEQSSTS